MPSMHAAEVVVAGHGGTAKVDPTIKTKVLGFKQRPEPHLQLHSVALC